MSIIATFCGVFKLLQYFCCIIKKTSNRKKSNCQFNNTPPHSYWDVVFKNKECLLKIIHHSKADKTSKYLDTVDSTK